MNENVDIWRKTKQLGECNVWLETLHLCQESTFDFANTAEDKDSVMKCVAVCEETEKRQYELTKMILQIASDLLIYIRHIEN